MHVGSKAFHEDAFLECRQRIIDEDMYVAFAGDALEGKKIDSPHFNPDSLRPRQLDIGKQLEYFCDLWKPIADRTVLFMPGNHDQYLSPNFDIPRALSKELGILDTLGGYQSWLNIAGLTLHFWHGKPALPRGAKDPVQREANQKAWLKNRLEKLAGSAHAQYMGHTHACLILPPIEQYALLDIGENCRGRFFTEQVRDINGAVWVPPDARWYVNTGTFRRTGGFGFEDYAEIAGYSPLPIATTITEIGDSKVQNISKVIF